MLLLSLLLFMAVACGPADEDLTGTATVEAQPVLPPATTDSSDAAGLAYPGVLSAPAQRDSPYPGPAPTMEGLQSEPPNPDLDLPDTNETTGVVGGVLIREITGQGYAPLIPQKLSLGEIVVSDSGGPALVRTRGDSPQAELFPTGIFIFRNVPPGEYGLVIDLGFTEFLVEQPDGGPLTFSLEAGQALDIGQVITQSPG